MALWWKCGEHTCSTSRVSRNVGVSAPVTYVSSRFGRGLRTPQDTPKLKPFQFGRALCV